MKFISKLKSAIAAIATQLSGKKDVPAEPIKLVVKKQPVKKKAAKPKLKKA